MNKIIGYFYRGVGKFFDIALRILMAIVNIFVDLFSAVRRFFSVVISMGGCLIIFLFMNPFYLFGGSRLRWLYIIGLLAFIVPILGNVSETFLKYIHYMVTEFFYDRADHYLLGKESQYENIGGYGRAYWEKQERERLRREEERRKRREEEFKEQFRNFGGFTWTSFDNFEDFDEFFRNAGYGGYYENPGSNGNYNSGPQNNTSYGFKEQYENACDTLGINYNADKYEVKLAYRKMAKKYHPDLNKEEGAKEKFQKVNAAYEFLNDSNIEMYKRMSGNN